MLIAHHLLENDRTAGRRKFTLQYPVTLKNWLSESVKAFDRLQ